MSAITSKVRLFDLAKELKIDTKRLIEEARREGVDVSVPSNSISKELAEKIRDKYFPDRPSAPKRTVKIVRKAEESRSDLLPLSIEPSDSVLAQVTDLVRDYAGVILLGPPGTSKTWYARQIAAA